MFFLVHAEDLLKDAELQREEPEVVGDIPSQRAFDLGGVCFSNAV